MSVCLIDHHMCDPCDHSTGYTWAKLAKQNELSFLLALADFQEMSNNSVRQLNKKKFIRSYT